MNQASDETLSPPSRSRSLRVLIADDHADAAETLAMVMSLEGHGVAVAGNGKSALQLAEKIQPDVAILDIGMPEMDGHTLAQRIRDAPWGASCLVIALTGFGEAEDKLRARGSHFDEHFTKPVDPSQLLARIAAWQLGKSGPADKQRSQ